MSNKHKEGDFFKSVELDGKKFDLYYGYYEEKDKYSKYAEPIPIYPDFIRDPVYNDEGYPFATEMQDTCEHFQCDGEGESCYLCSHFCKGEELIGICKCEARKKSPEGNNIPEKDSDSKKSDSNSDRKTPHIVKPKGNGKKAPRKRASVKVAVWVLIAALLFTSAVATIGLIKNGRDNGTPDETTEQTNDNSQNDVITNYNYYLVKFGYPDTMTEEDKAATFYPNDQIVTSGELVYILPTPTREGYVFSGWYYDSDLTMLATPSDVVSKNMTLYPSMRPISEAEEIAGDGSIHYVSAIDVTKDYRVTVKAPSAEAVISGISLISVSEGSKEESFTVSDNGDGTYTINPTNGFKEGKTYQLYAIDREKGIEADGRVPSDDEYVLFIHDGEVQRKEIRYYNIFIYREEVDKLRVDDQVTFLDFSSVEDFGMAEAAGLYYASVTESGEVSLVNNAASGTFTYAGELEIGEIVAVHDGEIDMEGRTIESGDVAYIEIVARDGYVYSYVSAKAKDVIFLPDIIPIPYYADTDDNEDTVTVENSLLDFTYFENQSILNAKTTVDVDDFIVLYNGILGETTEAEYARITQIVRGDESTTITFVYVTAEEMQESLDSYVINGIDMTLPDSELENLENSMAQQALGSGFAEKSAMYMAQNMLGIQERIQWGESYQVTPSQVDFLDVKNLDVEIEAGNLSWQLRFDPPSVKAEISTSLQKVTQINKATGLRVAFGVTIPIGLELVENGIKVVESYNLDLYVTFEQEVAFNTRFSVDVQWDNWAYIVWWIDEVVVDAGFEMGTYTGVGAIASIHTSKGDKSYIWNELVEDTDGGAYSTASSIATRLNDMLKDGNMSFFEGKNGMSLANEYAAMLEREVDYVDILALKLYHAKGYLDPKTHLVNYVLDVSLVLRAKINVTMGISFEALTVKQYSFNMRLFDGKATTSVIDKQTPYSNFNFFIMGNLGIRAGVRVTFSVGLISVKIDNLGAMAELGVFVDLYGFFYFHYDWNGNMAKPNIQAGGGIYTVIGIYLDLDLFGGVLMDLASFTIHLVDEEWPLWDSGNQISIVAPASSSYNINMGGRSHEIGDYYFRMLSMDMTTGKTTSVRTSRSSFDVTVTNPDKFTYDSARGILTVNPDYTDLELNTQIILTYNKKSAVFSAQPLTITLNVSWKKTEPYRNIYFNEIDYEEENLINYTSFKTISVLEGSAISGLPRNLTTTRPGYDFAGWMIRCSELPEYDGKLLSEVDYLEGVTMPAAYISLHPVWTPRNDVALTIRHYLDPLDESGEYELIKEEVVTGTPDAKYISELNDYILYSEDGFSLDYAKLPVLFEFETENQKYVYYGVYVKGDGTSVLELYYTRDSYRVSFNVNNTDYSDHYDDGGSANYSLKFGEALPECNYGDLYIPGYIFKGWSTSKDGSSGIIESLPETMPAFKDKYVTYYAIWEGIPTEYSVRYFLENTNHEFEFIGGDRHTATVGDKLYLLTMRPEDETLLDGAWRESFEVFDSDGVLYTKDHIDYSGDLTINVYYRRNYQQVWWNYSELEYYWSGQIITFKELSKEGYTFVGWESNYVEDTNIYKAGDTFEVLHYSLFFSAVFTPRDDIPYTVYHVREDLNGEYDVEGSLSETETIVGTADTDVTPEVRSYVGFNSPTVSTVTVAPDGSTVVVYKYERKSYNITIETDGGRMSGMHASRYTYGEGFYLTESGLGFSKTGYEFAGLYLKGDETKTPIDSSYWISGDVVLSDEPLVFVALWVDGTYTYHTEHYLEGLDGSYVLQQTDSASAGVNASVTAQAVDFVGFSLDKTISGTVESGTVVSEDEILVLKLYYTRNSYDAKWYDHDGTTLLYTTTVKFGATVTAPSDLTATREGYTFDSWNIGDVVMSTSGASFNANDHGVWTANTYVVIFNSGSGQGSMDQQTMIYDTTYTLSPNTFQNSGLVFAGWSTEPDGQVVYLDQQQVTNLAASGSVTLYAQWTEGVATDYKVEYYGESLSGNGFELIKSEIYSGPENSTATATAISIAGFSFDSSNENNVTAGVIVSDSSLVLKLYYTRNSYDLIFDFAGESMKQAVDGEIVGFEIDDIVVSVKYGASVADEIAKISAEEYPGYTFGGWGSYSETMPATDLTLTAEWTPITITVSYHPGASYYDVSTTAEQTEFTYAYGSVISAPDVTFVSSSGYVAAGWIFNDGSGGVGQYPILTGWPLTLVYGYHSSEDFIEGTTLDLSPFWSSAYTAIKFNSNGGIGSMDDQLIDRYAGQLPINANSFTREGYTFVGWNTASDGSGDFYEDRGYFTPIDASGTNEVTLYAQWEETSE